VKEYDIRIAIHNHGPEDKVWPSPLDVLKLVKILIHASAAASMSATLSAPHRCCTGHPRDWPAPFQHAHERSDRFSQQGEPSSCRPGIMPIREIFEALIKTNYKGFVDLEYEIHAMTLCPASSSPLPTCARPRRYGLSGIVAELETRVSTMLVHEDRLFPAEPGARSIARTLYAGIQDYLSSVPMAIRRLDGSRRMSHFPIQPSSLYNPTTTSTVCFIARAFPSKTSNRTPELTDRVKSGVSLPAITTSFAEPQRVSGSTSPSTSFWPDQAPFRVHSGPLLRHHLRKAAHAGVSSARPLRAIQY